LYEATRLESVEEIRRVAAAERTPTLKEATPKVAGKDRARRFRPTQRPTMLLVCVVDDGHDTGELVRVRTPRLVIGRTEGDLLIGHDAAISSRHAELVSETSAGRTRWRLRDLESTNGTFIRVNAAMLKDKQEVLVGSRRLRFNAAGAAASPPPIREATQKWQAVNLESIGSTRPRLTELKPQGEGERFSLAAAEQWIGSDPSQATVVFSDDPFLGARHARLYEDSQGRWHIEDASSLNGTWLRITEVPIGTHAEFLAGEQRFLVRVLGHEDPIAS
jgi:pSer/pThr/pTyr-binding forkhead associated (FHA) protein